MKQLLPLTVVERINTSLTTDSYFTNLTPKSSSKLVELLTNLWFYVYSSQLKDDPTLSHYVNLPKGYFKKFYITLNKKKFKHSYLLKTLERLDLIQVNETYSTRHNFCKSYKINKKFIFDSLTAVEIDFDKINGNFKDKKDWLKKYPNYRKQIEDAYSISIQLDSYFDWLDSNEGLQLKSVYNKKSHCIEERFLTADKIMSYKNAALKIHYKNLWFKLSDEGRFYNSLTNLTSTALPFLRLKNSELFELDVVNCQPLLLSTLIKSSEYKKDCEEGVFYDKLSKQLNTDRHHTKLLTYKYIFFSSNILNSGKVYDAVEELYPGLIEQLNKLRPNFNIAREMQRIESEIFVNKVGASNFDLMLRHDAVFCKKEDYDFVELLIKNEFMKKNLNVKLKKH